MQRIDDHQHGCEGALKIHCCCFEEDIFPWHQDDLRTPSWRFYWCPSPGGHLLHGQRQVALLPTKFYIVPGYLKFSTRADAPFSQFYIHFGLNERQPPQSQIFELDADAESLSLIRRFIRRETSPAVRQLTRLTALSVVASALMRLPEGVLRLPPEYDPRIERVLAWIHRNLNLCSTNDRLAKIAQMSRNGFIHLFEKELGEPPQKYCRRRRIERGCELLLYSAMPMEDIAEATGFADRYHFSRVFWQVMHFTPAAFRRNQLVSHGMKRTEKE